MLAATVGCHLLQATTANQNRGQTTISYYLKLWSDPVKKKASAKAWCFRGCLQYSKDYQCRERRCM
jgi:hypothetical protein